MEHKKAAIVTFLLFTLSACEGGSEKPYEVINKEADGKISIINQSSGRLLVVNKSNRIDDVIDLNISSEEISKIKEAKQKQDAALKVKTWPEVKITSTKYSIVMATRYYKDRLLYSIKFSPSDKESSYKARTISINLRDENGFVLEKIQPASWVSVINEKGNPVLEQTNGEIPMTLDNYLEISAYDPNWYFK